MAIEKNEVFEYLDELRESGVTNMWGAAAYIEAEFDCDRKQSVKLLGEWMETFSQRHPQEG